MIQHYGHQKALSEERLSLKTAETQFQNIITTGTNCSNFESEIISVKAKECFGLGEYSEVQCMQPGQMIWMAVSDSEPAGKPLSSCQMVRVVLSVHSHDDLTLRREGGSWSDVRQQQIMRVSTEAGEQHGLLTQEDLGRLLGCDVRTIRKDIQQMKKKHVLVPTRGMKKDIGPCVTHKVRAVELFLEGRESLEIARDLKHSLPAVERYISTFCRVLYCHRKTLNSLKTALMVGASVRSVNRYLEIADRYRRRRCYRERLGEIEATGQAFWEAQDSKKKAGRKGGRR